MSKWLFCPKCGTKLDPADSACRACGAALPHATTVASGEQETPDTAGPVIFTATATPSFYGVNCVACGSYITLFTDPSAGKGPGLGFAGPGKLRVTCTIRECHHEHGYPTDALVRFAVAELN